MEFVTVKDPHSKFGFRNKIRYDYENDITKKFKFINDYILNINDGFVLSTGDVFDESYERKWSFTHYNANVIKFEKTFTYRNNELLVSIAGNHDYFNGEDVIEKNIYDDEGNIIKIERTIYGDFVARGLIRHLDDNPVEDEYAVIHGISFQSDLNKVRDKIQELCDNHNSEKFLVIVLHQNVTPKGVKNITEFTYEELSKYDVDLFILGHYHIGYPYQEMNGTGFINQWNLTRVSRDYEVKMDKHTPEIYHVKIENEIEVTRIEVPHKSFDDCFVPEFKSVLELKKNKKSLDISLDLDTQINDTDIIELIAKEKKYNDGVKADALKYMLQDS